MNLDSVDAGVPIDAAIAGPRESHHSDASQAKEFISAGTLAAAIVHCRVVGVALGATANTT